MILVDDSAVMRELDAVKAKYEAALRGERYEEPPATHLAGTAEQREVLAEIEALNIGLQQVMPAPPKPSAELPDNVVPFKRKDANSVHSEDAK